MSEFDNLKQWLKDTEDEPLEEMTEFFGARIDGYEEHMGHWKKSYERMGRMIPAESGKLLDLGCGTGLELDEIFKRRPDIQVTGIDLSHEMLQVLRKKYPEGKLELIQGDYFAEPLGEERYDVVISFETLHHFKPEKKLGLYEKVCRSLKAGGFYLEADYMADDEEWERVLMEECERRRKKWGIPGDVFVHFDTPLTAEHQKQLLEKAEFARVQVHEEIEGDEPTMIQAWKCVGFI